MTVSGHRAESSIKNYACTSEAKKKMMSEMYSTSPKTSGSANVEEQPSTSKTTVTEDMTAEPETENMPSLNDSQLERVFDQIPDQFPFNPQGQPTTTVTTGSTTTRASYTMNGIKIDGQHITFMAVRSIFSTSKTRKSHPCKYVRISALTLRL